jgi:hypothetical protein
MSRIWPLTLPILAAFALTAPADAQRRGSPPPRFAAGLRFAVINPVGSFGDAVDAGFGVDAHALVHLVPSGVFSLRADLGFLNYGSESDPVCLAPPVGCRFEVDLITANNIGHAYVGPQLALPAGPVRPYAHAGAGFAWFSTATSLEGVDAESSFDDDDHLDDLVFSWLAGGGIAVPFVVRGTRIAVDLGARYHANHDVEYLAEGDIRPDVVDGFDVEPRRGDADFVSFLIGVSIGFGR